MFRKKLDSVEPTDHAIVNDLMHVIWARGQELEHYVHNPPSGLETEAASLRDFYQPDELKYHGHKSQRGVTQINFYDEVKPNVTELGAAHELDNPCQGHWRHPRTCAPENFDCEYYAEWETIGRGDAMRFKIQTTHTQLWTGIGFSDDQKMSQTDAILAMLDSNGRPFFMDTWINGYTRPNLDDIQNIRKESGKVINGSLILVFERDRATGDKRVRITTFHF